jgi:hypothetical protein
MKPLSAFIASVVFMAAPVAYSADIYSWIDDRGVRHFSNLTPPVSGEDIDIITGFDSPAEQQESKSAGKDTGHVPYSTSPLPAAVPDPIDLDDGGDKVTSYDYRDQTLTYYPYGSRYIVYGGYPYVRSYRSHYYRYPRYRGYGYKQGYRHHQRYHYRRHADRHRSISRGARHRYHHDANRYQVDRYRKPYSPFSSHRYSAPHRSKTRLLHDKGAYGRYGSSYRSGFRSGFRQGVRSTYGSHFGSGFRSTFRGGGFQLRIGR